MLTMISPRRMTKPNVLFCSRACPEGAPSFALIFLNSSQSARTKFMCLSKASIWPVNTRESDNVILSLKLIRFIIFEFFEIA